MYINIGENEVVRDSEIIGIFDMDTSTVKKVTRDFLNSAQKNEKVVYVNYDLPKSFVVTNDKVYVAPLNTNTIIKRAKKG